jgi:hypothetical protein
VWQCVALRIGCKLTQRASSGAPHPFLLIPDPALGSSTPGAAATRMPGLGKSEDSGLLSGLGHTRVLRVLSVPLVSGSPVGKEVEAGESMGKLRVLLMHLQDA